MHMVMQHMSFSKQLIMKQSVILLQDMVRKEFLTVEQK